MTSAATPVSNKDWGEWLLWVAVAALALGYAAWQWAPMHQFAWKYDEGIYIQEATLQLQGYRLYTDIWSERPPLFSMMLALAFSLVEPSVLVGRSVVLLTAVMGLFGLALLARHLAGRLAAIVSVFMMVLMPHFFGISAMILIELPPVAFALLSLGAAAAYYRGGGWFWFLAAAWCFAASGLIKPVSAPMLVPLSLLVLLRGDTSGLSDRLKRWLLLMLLMALPVVLVMLFFGPTTFMSQIIGTLFSMRGEHALSLSDNWGMVWSYLTEDKWGLSSLWSVLLAALGSVHLARERRWPELAVVVSWLACVLGALLTHTPIRRHHLFLLVPALIVPASIALQATVGGLRAWGISARDQKGFVLLLLVGALTFLGAMPSLALTVHQRRVSAIAPRQQTPDRQAGIRFLQEQTPADSLVISDDPMLAFMAGRDIPPALAAPSFKRVEAGALGGQELVRLTQEASPSAIVFWDRRLARVPGYLDWVRANYVARRAYEDERLIYTPMPLLDRGAEQPARSDAGIEFLGSYLSNYAVEPGEYLDLELFFHAYAPIDRDYVIFVHLLDDEGRQWGAQDLRPLDGLNLTSQWLSGDTIAQHVALQVRSNAPAGEKVLGVGLYGPDRKRLALQDGEGRPLGDGQVILAHHPVVRWPASFNLVAPERAQEADLGRVAHLVGYDGAGLASRPGERIDVTLHWQCLEPMRTSYTAFIHLVDEQGALVAQSDQIPGQGRFPTTGWIAGEYLRDTHQITLPPTAPPGRYEIHVGLYDLGSGERLPVESDGIPQPDGRVLLEERLVVAR